MTTIDLFHPNEINKCKGVFFRGRRTTFIGKDNSYNEHVKLYPLKRISCGGCDKCGWIDDDLREHASFEHGVIVPHIEDGKIYTLIVSNVSYDWESGLPDGYDLEFIEVKNG